MDTFQGQWLVEAFLYSIREEALSLRTAHIYINRQNPCLPDQSLQSATTDAIATYLSVRHIPWTIASLAPTDLASLARQEVPLRHQRRPFILFYGVLAYQAPRCFALCIATGRQTVHCSARGSTANQHEVSPTDGCPRLFPEVFWMDLALRETEDVSLSKFGPLPHCTATMKCSDDSWRLPRHGLELALTIPTAIWWNSGSGTSNRRGADPVPSHTRFSVA